MSDDKHECKFEDMIRDNHTTLQRLTEGEWYTNKELFEKFRNLESLLTKVVNRIDKYNGLIEARQKDEERIDELEEIIKQNANEDAGKDDFIRKLILYSGWLATGLMIAERLGWL